MQNNPQNDQQNKLQNDFFVLGITGGIGSGKSEVLHFLESCPGAVVLEADKAAHRLMEPGEDLYREILDTFGQDLVDPDGRLDRKRLGDLVFHDPDKLCKLNSIVHPAVKQYIRRDIRKKRKDKMTRLYVIEAALLLQDGYHEICDEIWYVYVPKDIRIRRLLASRGGTAEKWESVMANQPEDAYFLDNCDRTIPNMGTTEELKACLTEGLACKGVTVYGQKNDEESKYG